MKQAIEVTDLDATALSRLVQSGYVSCREVMQAYLARIEAENPKLNAIVSLADTAQLLLQADVRDGELRRGAVRGWLHGLPLAVKDTSDAVGFPTTRGCTLLRNAMPARDSIMVERLKNAGGIVIGKTNVPELALGSHTFNDVFGATKNAWDEEVSAGGSSGGAAAALARRLLPVADGSDFMGSLRNPASWNSVFALRPTQGRVPQGPGQDIWIEQLGTSGPMARTVRDLGNLLRVQAGHDARQPLSLQSGFEFDDANFDEPADVLRGLRVAWLGDLCGYLATDDGVLETCRSALSVLQAQGAIVEDIAPGFAPEEVWHSWLVLRRAMVGARVEPLLALPGGRNSLKDEALWEYDCSRSLSYSEFIQASQARTRLYQHFRSLFEKWDLLVLPSCQVWPFPSSERWPKKIGGREMDTYHRWMEVSIYATLAGLPALAAPAGFHRSKRWPIGIQLLGAHSSEEKLLRVARAYEQVNGALLERRP